MYGARSQKWNSINKLVYQVLQKGEIKRQGTGDERREYIHVKDAAKLSTVILHRQDKNKNLQITDNKR